MPTNRDLQEKAKELGIKWFGTKKSDLMEKIERVSGKSVEEIFKNAPEIKETEKIEIKKQLVEIMPNENFSCCIGKVWYRFKAGQRQLVPLEVKEILKNAHKIVLA